MKTKQITLFGKELILSERCAADVLNLSETIKVYTTEEKSSVTFYLMVSTTVIEDALKSNISNLRWYNFLKKSNLPKILNANYILKNLSQKEIMDLTKEVYELEGTSTTSDDKEDTTEKKSLL